MAILSELVQRKKSELIVNEENLENGMIWAFMNNTHESACYCNGTSSGFCWLSPGSGTVIIEVWGAGGSAGAMRCCGAGLPGNSGAYAKRSITVDGSSYITGNIGKACGNSTLCCKGQSESTEICWIGSVTDGCICAEGGVGGHSFCMPGTTSAIACCFIANSMCNTSIPGASSGCFWIINNCSGMPTPTAYGGDVNCGSRIGCTAFRHCNPCCNCYQEATVPLPYGFYGKNGSSVTIHGQACYNHCGSGSYINNIRTAFDALGNPTAGAFPEFCWDGQACATSSQWYRVPMMPPGAGAPPVKPGSSCYDYGLRGGFGAVRIKFISD